MVDCTMLITQMCEKGVLQPTPTQNVQMMSLERREEYPSVNMLLRSSATTRGDMWKEFGEGGRRHDVPIKGLDSESKQRMKTPEGT